VSSNEAPTRAAVKEFKTTEVVSTQGSIIVSGGEVVLSAGGFTPSESVIIGFAESAATAKRVTASAAGRASATVKIPTSKTGEVTAYLYGTTSKRGVKQVLVVSSLPATGRSAGSPVTFALVLALIGASTLLVRRRLTRQVG
jgi:LPXTG-motif cell wall-anchored protein